MIIFIKKKYYINFEGLIYLERTNILVDYILSSKKDNDKKIQSIINSAFSKDNKLVLNQDDIKFVGALLFEKFYIKYQNEAWNKYINFIDKKFNFDYRWFDIYLPFLKTSKEYFIQNALNYIIENQDTKWKEKFQEIDYEKYNWIKPLEYIPEKFESFLDLYIWIESNEIKDHLYLIKNKNISVLLWKIIENDLLQIYKHNFSAKSFENVRILLEKCKNDYKILVNIFTFDVLPLKLWFLNNIETIGIGLISLQSLELGINTFGRKSKFDLEYERIIAKEINNFIFKNIKILQFKREHAKIFANVICFYDNHINFDDVNFLYEELLNFLVKKEIYQNPYEKAKFINLIFDEFYDKYSKCFNLNSLYSLSKIISFVKKEHQEKLITLFINSLKKEIKWYNEKLLENIDYSSLAKYIDIEKILQLNPQNEYTIKFYFHLLLNLYKHLPDIRIKEKLVDTFFKFDKNLYFFKNPFIEVDFTNKFFQLDFDEEEIRKITDFLDNFSLLVKFYTYQKNEYIKEKIFSLKNFTLNNVKENLLYLIDNNLNDLATKIYLKFKDKIDCKSHRYKEFCLAICNYKLVEIFKSNEELEKKIIALLYFEKDTEKSFKILENVLTKEQNRLYLYNMLNILLKLENKEQLEIYLEKLKNYDINFKYEKSEFEYFTLLNVYMFLKKKKNLKNYGKKYLYTSNKKKNLKV